MGLCAIFKPLKWHLLAYVVAGGLVVLGSYCWTLRAVSVRSGELLVPETSLAAFGDARCQTPLPLQIRAGEGYRVIGCRRQRFNTQPFIGRSPIVRETMVYQVVVPSGEQVWCSPNIAVDQLSEPGRKAELRVRIDYPPDPVFMAAACMTFAVVAFVLSLSRLGHWRYWLSYPILRGGLILLYFGLNGLFFSYDADPGMYITIAREWSAGDRHTAVPGSVGAAVPNLLLIPFLSSDPLPYVRCLSLFNVTVLGTLQLVAIMIIAWRFMQTTAAKHAVAIAAATLPVVTQVIRVGVPGPDFVGKTIVGLTAHSPFSLSLYRWANQTNWNAMSEPLMMTVVSGALLCALLCNRFRWRHIGVGLLLGYAIACRYSAIALLPAFVALELLRDRTTPWRTYAAGAVMVAIGGVIGVSPQLIDNFLINGSPFAPTVSQTLFTAGEEQQVGGLFQLHNVTQAWPFLLQIHFKALCLFTFCLLRSQHFRLAFACWLWSAGVLTFVSLLNFYSHNAVRYMLPCLPALFIALGLAVDSMRERRATIAAVLVAFNMAILTPEDSSAFRQLLSPLQEWVIAGATTAVIGVLLWRNKRELAFFAGMQVCLANGAWPVPLAIFILLGPWLIVRTLWSRQRPTKLNDNTAESAACAAPS